MVSTRTFHHLFLRGMGQVDLAHPLAESNILCNSDDPPYISVSLLLKNALKGQGHDVKVKGHKVKVTHQISFLGHDYC